MNAQHSVRGLYTQSVVFMGPGLAADAASRGWVVAWLHKCWGIFVFANGQTIARALAICGAPIIAAATVSQGWLSVSESMDEGASLAEGVWIYLCYFTVLTNTFVVLVLARAALAPQSRTGLNAPRIELMAVTSILFVGAVYNLLLASQWDPQGLRKLNDVILHVASPLLFTLFWLLRSHGALNWRDALYCALWPGAYSVYALTRGAVDGFYPYYFINPGTMPWFQVASNMAGLIIVFTLAALLLAGLANARHRRRA